jgi:hypothetical protein
MAALLSRLDDLLRLALIGDHVERVTRRRQVR